MSRWSINSVKEPLSINSKFPGLTPGPSHDGVLDYDGATICVKKIKKVNILL